MTLFWLLALVMTLAALATLIAPLWFQRRRAPSDEAATLAVYRERDAALTHEHARGQLDDREYAEAREELERELLDELPRTDLESERPAPRRRLATPIVLALLVPAIALGIYLETGRPGLIGASSAPGLSPAQIERLRALPPGQRIRELQPLVEQRPRATRAWMLLAQAYRTTERYGDAVDAYARVRALGEANPTLLARQAEALLLANGHRFSDRIEQLLQQALDGDADNPLALLLAGHAAMARGDAEQAVSDWRRLTEQMPADSNNRALLERLIARAQGDSTAASASAGSSGATNATGEHSANDNTTAQGPRLQVRIRLADNFTAPPNTRVFVFARRAGSAGNGPPLAVARTTVSALPGTVVLTDAQAMMPNRTLSGADRVFVTARAALQGGVMPQSGDLEGRSPALTVGPDVQTTVTIDQRVP